jgi:hypothetical protein
MVIARLFSCAECGAWWGGSDLDMPETQLVFRLVEPHSTRFLWQDYHGWQKADRPQGCPACGVETAESALVLRCDAEGHVIWPEIAEEDRPQPALEAGNPFFDYVAQSERIDENVSFLTAREAQRAAHAWGYTAEMEDIREQMDAMRKAFKEVVYRYAPILPPGWRVTGDYDKWVKGQACAGFLHGEINPDAALMVGGCCRTVAELEMQLDRLHGYVCGM